MSHFDDLAFFYASASPSPTRGWFSIKNAAILIGMFGCAIVMLIGAAQGLSKSTGWYEPTPMNLLGP